MAYIDKAIAMSTQGSIAPKFNRGSMEKVSVINFPYKTDKRTDMTDYMISCRYIYIYIYIYVAADNMRSVCNQRYFANFIANPILLAYNVSRME